MERNGRERERESEKQRDRDKHASPSPPTLISRSACERQQSIPDLLHNACRAMDSSYSSSQ